MRRAIREPFSPLGLLLAPPAAVAAAGAHFALWHWDTAQAVGALYAALVIVPLSYFLSLFIGVPYLYALRWLGILNMAGICLGALILGLAVGFLIGAALFPSWDWYGRLFYLSLGGFCGLGAGLAYWLVLRLHRPE